MADADDELAFADTELPDRLPRPLFVSFDHGALHVERRQLTDAGRDLSAIEATIERARGLDPADRSLAEHVRTVLDAGPELPMRPAYPYDEPSTSAGIRERRPGGFTAGRSLDRATAREAIHGGWLGACAGCLLGKPVQGWGRDRIEGFLRDSGQYPLSGYMRSDVPDAVAERYAIHANLEPIDAFVNEVDGMPIDDDIDYVAVGLGVLERHGRDFEAVDVANYWLENMPMFNTYTAERAAYRNLANLVMPPESATHRNPYREAVGAMIRADPWGYAAIGDPERAAELAFRDASISHTKNGIYGELWAAAMIAAAPVVDDVESVLEAGLAAIPANCRLAEEVGTVRDWYAEGIDVHEAVDRLHDRWDETDVYEWVHTLPNAQVVTTALLWSDGAFGEAICRAVEAGFDTDSHAATVGSVLGAYHGADALPAAWTDPLEDRVELSLPAFGTESIAALAERTTEVWATPVR